MLCERVQLVNTQFRPAWGEHLMLISFAPAWGVCSCVVVMRKPTKQANDIAVNTRVSEDVRAAVDRVCQAENLGMSDVVREALVLFLGVYGSAGNRFLSSIERDAILAQVRTMAGRVKDAIEAPGVLPPARRAARYSGKS